MEPQSPKKPRQRRTSALRVRLSVEERRLIETAAQVLNQGLCSFARVATIKAAGGIPTPPPKRPRDDLARALAGWTGQLARIGNLVNQIARAANVGAAVPTEFHDTIIHELRALRRAMLMIEAGPLE